MRCLRALFISQLVPAASSLDSLLAASLLGDLPKRLSRRISSVARTSGPTSHRAAGLCPCTQARLGASIRTKCIYRTYVHGKQ